MAAAPFKVKAVFDYSSPHDDDLSFPNGQVITVTEEEDVDWYVGEYTDDHGQRQSGLFPRNFVEKYEPEIPSRPTRPTRPKAAVPAEAEVPDLGASQTLEEPKPKEQPRPTPAREEPPTPVLGHAEPAAISQEPMAPIGAVETPPPKPKATPAKGTPTKGPPPAVSEKPSSFRDRIAAFNKSEASPVLPFKPGTGSGASNYAIKKPFVAPPPSRSAYVPLVPKQEPVQKIYRREEDPEIAERQAQDHAAAEAAGLVASNDEPTTEAAQDEEGPKPQSLKERIALLQKQQAEQAQRRADTATKEKPKRPAKKRTESAEQIPADEAAIEEPEKSLPIRGSLDSTRQLNRAGTEDLDRTPTSPSSTREQEILSDGNEADLSAAGETTEAHDDTTDQEDIAPTRTLSQIARNNRAPTAPLQEADVGDEEDTTEGQTEEEDEVDAETRRKLELRERMAKISGGMGMAGMFGPQPGMAIAPPSRKPIKTKERQPSDSQAASPPPPRPMIPVPGMASAQPSISREPEVTYDDDDEQEQRSVVTAVEPDVVPDIEDVSTKPTLPPGRSSLNEERSAPPPIPGGRPVPILPPQSTRPMAPPPPSRPTPYEDADDDSILKQGTVETPKADIPPGRAIPPPVPAARASIDSARSPPPVPTALQSSYFGDDAASEASIPFDDRRRSSRIAPPPIPGSSLLGSPSMQSRAPPPPPPTTAQQYIDDRNEGESEYEGDYDTDIASGDKPKAALKGHPRRSSTGENVADEPLTPLSPPQAAPAIPSVTSRAVPPRPPPTQAPTVRTSSEMPRAAPPPLPPSRAVPDRDDEDEEFANYRRYQESSRAPPPPPAFTAPPPVTRYQDEADESSDDLYEAPTRKSTEPPRSVPALPLEASPRVADSARLSGRQSLEANRGPVRKSMEGSGPGGEGYIARDIDLAESTLWWTQPNNPPPAFQNRNDLIFEVEESSTSKRGGKTTVSKDVYVLFHDHSQSVITARYDASNPADVQLEQRSEPPPPRLRQDQLEAAWRSYGAKIAEQAVSATSSKRESSAIGDGTAHAFAAALVGAFPDALRPVGTRAYGAPVYVNIGNASVQQHDEIRPGDLITFRNARFQGKHGGLHQKYSQDVGGGAAGHVGVVLEWDGTKKKVRAAEQGRGEDGKGKVKVRVEGYRLGDLKSGEVRVWRVVGRAWVGWDGEK